MRKCKRGGASCRPNSMTAGSAGGKKPGVKRAVALRSPRWSVGERDAGRRSRSEAAFRFRAPLRSPKCHRLVDISPSGTGTLLEPAPRQQRKAAGCGPLWSRATAEARFGDRHRSETRAGGLYQCSLKDQHRVAVAQESVFPGDRLGIDLLDPGNAVG